MIYLAAPYSSPDIEVRQTRYEMACKATAELLREGKIIFSPIVHSHPLTDHGLPGDWAFWQKVDTHMLRKSDRLLVLMMPGWKESIGVQAEIALAERLGIGVEYRSFGREEATEVA